MVPLPAQGEPAPAQAGAPYAGIMPLAQGGKCRGLGQSPAEMMIDDLRLMIASVSDVLGGASFLVLRGSVASCEEESGFLRSQE